MQVFNLPHEFHCADDECRCVDVKQHVDTGSAGESGGGVAVRDSKLAASLTFLAGEEKTDLPDTILDCPDVKGALERRDLIEVKE